MSMTEKEIKEREKRRRKLKIKRNRQIRIMRYTLIAGIMALCAGVAILVSSLGRSSRKALPVQVAAETDLNWLEEGSQLLSEMETVPIIKTREHVPVIGAIYGMHVYCTGWSRFFADNSYCMAPAGNYITAIRATLSNQPQDMTGTIIYKVNLSGFGWLDWTEDGGTAGAEDTGSPLEAVCMRLTGELSEYYNILYSVLQDNSWSDWVENGEEAGVTGAGKRVDGIRISVVIKTAGQLSYAGNIDPNKPMVALTYDDGPAKNVTPRILKLLEENGGRATFFMVGTQVEKSMDLVRQMSVQGCEVANHTYNHKMMNKIDPVELKRQLELTNQVISDACGISPILMRPCGGARTAAGMEAVGAISMPAIMWSIDTLDWKTRNAESTIQAVRENVKDGDIILMHDLYSTSADASEVIIPELIAQGYQLVTVSELASYRGGMLPGAIYYGFWPD